MSKKATKKGVTSKEQSYKLHMVSKKTSHTGAKPLVPHISNPNVMVTQKVRDAQERNRKTIFIPGRSRSAPTLKIVVFLQEFN